MNFPRLITFTVVLLLIIAQTADSSLLFALLLKVLFLKGALFLGTPMAIGSFLIGQGIGFLGGGLFGTFKAAGKYHSSYSKHKAPPIYFKHKPRPPPIPKRPLFAVWKQKGWQAPPPVLPKPPQESIKVTFGHSYARPPPPPPPPAPATTSYISSLPPVHGPPSFGYGRPSSITSTAYSRSPSPSQSNTYFSDSGSPSPFSSFHEEDDFPSVSAVVGSTSNGGASNSGGGPTSSRLRFPYQNQKPSGSSSSSYFLDKLSALPSFLSEMRIRAPSFLSSRPPPPPPRQERPIMSHLHTFIPDSKPPSPFMPFNMHEYGAVSGYYDGPGKEYTGMLSEEESEAESAAAFGPGYTNAASGEDFPQSSPLDLSEFLHTFKFQIQETSTHAPPRLLPTPPPPLSSTRRPPAAAPEFGAEAPDGAYDFDPSVAYDVSDLYSSLEDKDKGKLAVAAASSTDTSTDALPAPTEILIEYLRNKLEQGSQTDEERREAKKLIHLLRQAYLFELEESMHMRGEMGNELQDNLLRRLGDDGGADIVSPSSNQTTETEATSLNGTEPENGGEDSTARLKRQSQPKSLLSANVGKLLNSSSTSASKSSGGAVVEDTVSNSHLENSKVQLPKLEVTQDLMRQLDYLQTEISQFFAILGYLDGDGCLQKVVCEVHAQVAAGGSPDGPKQGSYEQNIVSTFKVLDILLPSNGNLDMQDPVTKYRLAAKLGELSSSTKGFCQKYYDKCTFTSDEVMAMGHGVEQSVVSDQQRRHDSSGTDTTIGTRRVWDHVDTETESSVRMPQV